MELPLAGHSVEWIFLVILYVTNYSSGISLKTEWSEGFRTKGLAPSRLSTPWNKLFLGQSKVGHR